MKSGARIGLAVGVGYLLGRRRKLWTALTLATAVAAGRASRNPGGLMKWGQDLLQSPQLSNLGTLGKPLASAGRAAATAAAGSGVDVLSGKLRDSADSLRARSVGRRKGADTDDERDADVEPEDDWDSDADVEPAADETAEPVPTKRRRR